MAGLLRIFIGNDTEYELVAAGDPELVSGACASPPPSKIAAWQTAELRTEATGSGADMEGSMTYELRGASLDVRIRWRHTSSAAECWVEAKRLPGATRDLEHMDMFFADADGTKRLSRDEAMAATALRVSVPISLQAQGDGAYRAPPPNFVHATPDGFATVNVPEPIRFWDSPRMTPKRKRVLAVLGANFPMALRYQFGGKVLPAPRGQGDYNPMPMWSEDAETNIASTGTSCVNVNGNMSIQATGRKLGWMFDAPFNPAWVPYTQPDRLPSVGDVYLIFDDAAPGVRHCGFILEVPKSDSEFWITGDGGQKNLNEVKGQAAHLSKNPWKLMAAKVKPGIPPYATPPPGVLVPMIGSRDYGGTTGMVDSGRLFGWVDIDEVAMPDYDPNDAMYGDQNFRRLGEMIKILRAS